MFRVLQKSAWESSYILEFNKHVSNFLESETNPNGVKMHFLDIFLDEFAKVSKGKAQAATLNELLPPFLNYISHKKELKMIKYCCDHIFSLVLFHYKLGLQDMDDDMIESDLDTEDQTESIENEINEDPRAAGTDAVVPILQVDIKNIKDNVEKCVHSCVENSKQRKLINNLLQRIVHKYNHSQITPEKTQCLENKKCKPNSTKKSIKSRKRKSQSLNHKELGKKQIKNCSKNQSGEWLEEDIK